MAYTVSNPNFGVRITINRALSNQQLSQELLRAILQKGQPLLLESKANTAEGDGRIRGYHSVDSIFGNGRWRNLGLSNNEDVLPFLIQNVQSGMLTPYAKSNGEIAFNTEEIANILAPTSAFGVVGIDDSTLMSNLHQVAAVFGLTPKDYLSKVIRHGIECDIEKLT